MSNDVNNFNVNMKCVRYVKKKLNVMGQSDYIYLFLKFKNQNISKFRIETNFNFESKLRD